MKKVIFGKLAMLMLIIFASIALNVVLHEVGHFMTADLLGLNPEIHLESPVNFTESGTVATTPNFAYVSYNSATALTTIQDALIAVSGPLVNAALALISLALYTFYPKKSGLVKYTMLIFILISIVSLVANLIPISPSDGSIVLEYLSKVV